MLAYIHYSNDSNVGDKYSAPYHYFDFGKYNVINMRHMGSVIDTMQPYSEAGPSQVIS